METMTAAEYRAMKPAKKAKYRNQRVEYRGMKFASKKELHRYQELLLLQAAGEIRKLILQKKYILEEKQAGARAITYIADFVYEDRQPDGSYSLVVEDAKGYLTPVYRLKKKLMLAKYGIRIREV